MGNLFQSERDLNFWKRVVREVYKRFVKVAQVYLYDRNLKDELYGEDMDLGFNRGTSKPSYEVEAYLEELPEWKARLTKHGLDETRPLKAHFFVDCFSELGVQAPGIGDRLVIEGELYKIMQTNPRDYFGNTQKMMTYSVDLQRVRPESVKVTPRAVKEEGIYPESRLKGDFSKKGA